MANKRIALKLEEWPAPDREAWAAAAAPGDFLDPAGAAARWAPATRSGAMTAYGRWLAWLASLGPLDAATSATERATPETLAQYAGDLRAKYAGNTVVAYLSFLAMAAKAISPDRDWAWLHKIARHVKARSVPVRDKRARLQRTDDLVAFGMTLMADADDEETALMPSDITWERATQYRDGLMIALNALRPLRRRNFCAIEIGRHLVLRKEKYALMFTGEETKTGAPIDHPFPDALVPALERYLAHYRPWLCRQTANRDPRFPFQPAVNHLWVSKTGSALSEERYYITVRERTEAHFGRAMHPHLFRDCAATTMAETDPEHVRINKDVLGHASGRTTERFYTHARGVQASRRIQDHILELRRRGRDAGGAR